MRPCRDFCKIPVCGSVLGFGLNDSFCASSGSGAKIDRYGLAPVEAGMGRKDLKNIEGNERMALGQFIYGR